MLCLLIENTLKRRSLREKLRLCKTNKAVFRCYDTQYGKITVYTLYSYGNTEKAKERLYKAVGTALYTPLSPYCKEYLNKAVIIKSIEYFKTNRGKTVFLRNIKPETEHLVELCSLTKALYVSFTLSEGEKRKIYRLCGALPIYAAFTPTVDFIIDENYPIKINLPENLVHICPKEFSPLLFASLIYKENGRLII
jgi:hypothetical protein